MVWFYVFEIFLKDVFFYIFYINVYYKCYSVMVGLVFYRDDIELYFGGNI